MSWSIRPTGWVLRPFEDLDRLPTRSTPCVDPIRSPICPRTAIMAPLSTIHWVVRHKLRPGAVMSSPIWRNRRLQATPPPRRTSVNPRVCQSSFCDFDACGESMFLQGPANLIEGLAWRDGRRNLTVA